jgi:predicted flap endonuclease-1-like 5' DNA nuclease
MSFSRATWGAVLVLVLSIVLTGGAVAQSVPSSLVYPVGDLFTKADKTLVNGTAPPAAACGTAVSPSSPTGGETFTFNALPFNGTGVMYHSEKEISWTASLAPNSASATGFTIKAELLGPQTPLTETKPTGPVTPNAVASVSGSFKISSNGTNFEVHDGKPLAFKLTLTVTPGQAGPAPPTASGQLNCGAATKLGGVELIRGMPGDGDLDADGTPDPEDADKDGDGAPNTQESTTGSGAFATAAGAKGTVKCSELNPKPDEDPRIKPGDKATADFDQDGWSDQEECQKGFSPLSATSAPPKPRTLMDILLPIIIVLLILGIIAALVFLFLKFGKTAAITVLSTPELFIPAGTKGKYELSVQNLSKKGDPRTYQLLVTGMPEGWDAKLNIDHVTLDPEGGANNQSRFWLEVEAPVHQDPESAVVSVKAVPLNKAGRKDTLKMPGRASTITSINVPPGSKVPVKRGGKIAAAKPKEEEAPETPAGPSGDQAPVIAVEGVGETYAAKLNKAGIMTVGDLRKADPATVAKKTGAPPATVTSWQQMCELMQLEGVGPQFSEQLVRSGVTSIAQLAEQKPKELVAQIEKTNAARQVPIQGAGIQDKQAKNFVKTAERWMKDHPAGAAAAAPAAAAPAMAAAAAPTPPPAAAKPQLQVGGLKHEPPAFRQGEAVKSSVSVSNNGKEKSTIKLSLYVNDGLADVQTVTVKPGKAQDVQFKWTAQEKNKLNIRGELVSQ